MVIVKTQTVPQCSESHLEHFHLVNVSTRLSFYILNHLVIEVVFKFVFSS